MAKTIITKFKELFNKEITPRLKKRDKLDSEINKLYSEILMFFYEFGKENKCQVMWEDYNFKLEEIELKTYNSEKTGFIFLKMNGTEREELFEKESLEDLSKEQLIEKIKELQGD